MRHGIIDFGTNTIRLDVYECEEGHFQAIYDQAVFSRVLENVSNGVLSQDGIEHVIQGIEELALACRHFRCESVNCFSTASLRYILNADDVVEQVAFRADINIERISAETEALYDYLALSDASGRASGLGCDLGGGSLQLFLFDKNGPSHSASFPLGSSKMSLAHVSGTIPTDPERLAIEQDVVSALREGGFAPSGSDPSGSTLLATGGTAKTTLRFCRRTLGRPEDGSLRLSFDELDTVIKVLTSEPEDSAELLEDISPERLHTLVPGMAVLCGVMRYMGCDGMEVYSEGVREGFLIKSLGLHIGN